MTSEKDEPRVRRLEGDGASEAGGTVVLGLLAPPQMLRDVVEDLAAELPQALSEHVSDRVSWKVQVVRDPRVPDVEGSPDVEGGYEKGREEALENIREWRRQEGWDLAVCMTDLPLLRSDGRVVVAEASPQQDVALVSLPALGVIRRRQHAREAIVQFVREVFGESLGLGWKGEGRRDESGGRFTEVVASGGRVATGADHGHSQLVMPAGLGQLRLVVGMVRATHPFRVILGLSYALTAALGTAAFTVLTGTIWQLSGELGSVRLLALMVVSVVAMIVYIIVVHDLWYRPSGREDREYTVLFNATTVITLTLGALSFYAALFAATLVAEAFVIEGSVLGGAIGRTPGLGDFAALAWITTSLSMLGGALGSGLQTSNEVREASYTYHRERRTDEGREQCNDDSESGSG